MEQKDLNIFETGLDETSKAYLLETTRWTKFLAIVGFIFVGIFIILALFIMGAGSMYSAFSGTGFGAVGIAMLYLVLAAFYIYPIYALFKFSSCMKKGIHSGSQELISEGFRYQKNIYKFFGILAIITIALYLLGMIVGGLGFILSGR